MSVKKKYKKAVGKAQEHKVFKYLEGKDENHLLFTGFVMIMIAVVVISTFRLFSESSVSLSINRSHVSAPTRILGTNAVAYTDDYEVFVTDVSSSNKQDPAFPLESGETLLRFNISLTNTSQIEQTFTPVTQLYIRSREGGYYQMHPSMSLTNPIQSGALSPGQTIDGEVSFAIPEGLAEPLLYVDPGWDDIVPVVISVYR